MTTTTVPSTTTTACPPWCDGKHSDDMWHERILARAEGPGAYMGHEVQMVQALDPENTGVGVNDAWLSVLIRGNGVSDLSGEPWTVGELLEVSAMFARAAAALSATTLVLTDLDHLRQELRDTRRALLLATTEATS